MYDTDTYLHGNDSLPESFMATGPSSMTHFIGFGVRQVLSEITASSGRSHNTFESEINQSSPLAMLNYDTNVDAKA